jgi:hypothetical protein
MTGRWVGRFCRAAGEAVFWWHAGARCGADPLPQPSSSPGSIAARATRKLRLYVVANGLDTFGTLTYAEAAPSRVQVHDDVARFTRGLRRRLGGPLPWCWLVEAGDEQGHLHAHLFVESGIWPLAEELWRHGFVHGDHRHTTDDLRNTAQYASKEFSKSLPRGRRRYEVAHGFAPRTFPFEAPDEGTAWDDLVATMGTEPSFTYRSDDCAHWQGPPMRRGLWDVTHAHIGAAAGSVIG